MRWASEFSSAYGELIVDCSENGHHFQVVTHQAFDCTTVAYMNINLKPIVPSHNPQRALISVLWHQLLLAVIDRMSWTAHRESFSHD